MTDMGDSVAPEAANSAEQGKRSVREHKTALFRVIYLFTFDFTGSVGSDNQSFIPFINTLLILIT